MAIKVEGVGHVAVDVRAEPVQMLFADGEHTVPEAIVAHLGGAEALLGHSDMFREKTYKEVMTGFWRLVEKTGMNEAFKGFISSHFSGRGLL